MRNSIYKYLQKPNSDSPWKDANKDAFFGTIDVAGYEIITNIFEVLLLNPYMLEGVLPKT